MLERVHGSDQKFSENLLTTNGVCFVLFYLGAIALFTATVLVRTYDSTRMYSFDMDKVLGTRAVRLGETHDVDSIVCRPSKYV